MVHETEDALDASVVGVRLKVRLCDGRTEAARGRPRSAGHAAAAAAPVERPLEEGADLLGEGLPRRVRAADKHLVDDEGEEPLAEVRLQPANH